MTSLTNPFDVAKSIEIRTMGIKPHVPYYGSTEIILHHYRTPNNYPDFSPITLEQAENAPYRVNYPFSTELKINEVGDNYQFKIRWSYERKPQYIDRKSVVQGKSVEIGGRRTIKKKIE